MNEIWTLPAGKWEQTLVVQKSKFIAFATRVMSCDEAQKFIKNVAMPDATHHCYAYVTEDGQKSNDNGEPAGTAGLPILQAIKKAQLTNVVVVVERYFGGVKLGTGGLARAYGQAASQVLSSVKPVRWCDCCVLTLESGYEQQTAIGKLIVQYGRVMLIDYENVVRWRVAIPLNQQSAFVNELTEVLHTKPNVTVVEPCVWVEFKD